MPYENLCMYCFKNLDGESICPHCGKDAHAAVPQIQMLPGTLVYRDRFLIGRALGQDSSGIVYNAMDTKRGGTIKIREYLPRNCAERLNDGGVVPIPGMEDSFDAGMRKLRASVESVDDPKKRHFYFEENGTAYIAQRKNSGGMSVSNDMDDMDDDEGRNHGVVLYIAIAAAVVLAIAIGLIWFLNSMSEPEDITTIEPLTTVSADSTWMPVQTPTPTPYATATFAALKDPELSWMDYTYNGDVEKEYNQQQQQAAKPTKMPTIITEENHSTISGSSSKSDVTALQETLVKLGWMDYTGITGKYDSNTKSAVKDFQRYVNENCAPAKKLTVDGIAGKNTLQWLYNSSVSIAKPTPTPQPLVTAAPDSSVINASSSKTAIKNLQNQLITLGLLPAGSADGVFGSSTTTAVKNFQIRVNQLQGYNALAVDGKVDELTQAYLEYYVEWWQDQQQGTPEPAATATPTPTPMNTEVPDKTINSSSTREQIAYAQEGLVAVGLLKQSDVDGVYGKGTIAAVKRFQEWVNQVKGAQTLSVTGECDELTQAYLNYCVENGMMVVQPTQAPTQVPTAEPTQVPTAQPTEIPVENPDGEEGDIVVDPSSEKESISFVQEMLATIGLLKQSDVDGDYGSRTKKAVTTFQEYVNAQAGYEVLVVSGKCDGQTLQHLENYYSNGWVIGSSNPTETPTEAPTQPPVDDDGTINASSSRQEVASVQEQLSVVGLLKGSDVDGDYGAKTVDAVRKFQQFVNDQKGERVLEITGDCDPLTLQYLQYCADQGWNIEDSGDEPDPVEPPAEEPPVEEPPVEEAPSVGSVQGFMVAVNGIVNDGSLIEVPAEGKFSIQWNAESGAESYYIYLYDENGSLINSKDATRDTGISVKAKDLVPGAIYTMRVGAMPENGTDEDIVWQTVQLILPVQVTPEPTAEPTPEPYVGAPAIHLGSSTYQKDGVPYINDSSIIFSWMAEGDVQAYIATLMYEDGEEFSLGETTDTSKTVALETLTNMKPAGLWKLTVGAIPSGGSAESAVWSELIFAIPGEEPTEEPIPPAEEEVVPPAAEESIITYIDYNSNPDDIQKLQMALYKYGLINTDNAQPGVLDGPTLEAVAAFQMKVNEIYGAELYVIDPEMDAVIDEVTLDFLLYQELDLGA